MVAAFAADPLLRWVWPDDERYAACAPGFFGLLLDLRLEGGEVWDGRRRRRGRHVGPARRALPGRSPASAGRRRSGASASASATAGHTYDDAMSVPKDAGPHWYLGVLATEPARQGTGLGRAVTAPMLAAADRARLPAYLETASEAQRGDLRRLGFEPVREATMPDDGPPAG